MKWVTRAPEKASNQYNFCKQNVFILVFSIDAAGMGL